MHDRRPRVRRVPEAHGEDFADGGRRLPRGRQRPCLLCAKSRAHGTPFRRVCIYRRTTKKTGRRRHGQLTASAAVRRVPGRQAHRNTPRFAVCPDSSHTATLPDSPCARTAGTRQRSRIRRVPGRQAHGNAARFAVCPYQGHMANYGQFAVCTA